MSAILVVDDSGLARRRARGILEAAGYEVIEAEDGMAALESYFVEQAGRGAARPGHEGDVWARRAAKLREMDPHARVIVVSADVQTSSHEMVGRGRRRGLS